MEEGEGAPGDCRWPGSTHLARIVKVKVLILVFWVGTGPLPLHFGGFRILFGGSVVEVF